MTGTTTETQTHRLIASDRVEGTAVYNPEGKKLGTVNHFMVDKRTGKAEYAVITFGGFLGIGEDHFPLPWAALDYVPEQEGYVVNIDQANLHGAPSFPADNEPDFDEEYRQRVLTHYGYPYAVA